MKSPPQKANQPTVVPRPSKCPRYMCLGGGEKGRGEGHVEGESFSLVLHVTSPHMPRPLTCHTLQHGSLECIELIDMSTFKADSRPMEPRTMHLKITGMSCSSCVAKIERHMKKKRGQLFLSVLVGRGRRGGGGGLVSDGTIIPWCNVYIIP